jgi:aminoglycoside 3-N-acetyltransferase
MAFFHTSDAGINIPYRRLVTDLLALGIRPGGVLLVHSSLRSLGLPVGEDRAEMVVSALIDVLGEGGTLFMPALSYSTVNAGQPVFDVLRTPSCVGGLSEYFRRRPGTRRSVHPTHSVCGVGRQAAELLSGHEKDMTPCGPHSPFARLPKVGGQILFLGCGMRPNTSMHAIEEHAEVEYLFNELVEYTILLEDGSQSSMSVRRHNFMNWEQRYDRVESLMTAGLRKGRVLEAQCHLVESSILWPAALHALRQDPYYFVEQIV